MKTVVLTNEEIAIPVITKTFLTRSRVIALLADISYNEKGLDFSNLSKKEAMVKIRNHIWYQGLTTYPDWYEDTDDIPYWNEQYELATKYIESKFQELNTVL